MRFRRGWRRRAAAPARATTRSSTGAKQRGGAGPRAPAIRRGPKTERGKGRRLFFAIRFEAGEQEGRLEDPARLEHRPGLEEERARVNQMRAPGGRRRRQQPAACARRSQAAKSGSAQATESLASSSAGASSEADCSGARWNSARIAASKASIASAGLSRFAPAESSCAIAAADQALAAAGAPIEMPGWRELRKTAPRARRSSIASSAEPICRAAYREIGCAPDARSASAGAALSMPRPRCCQRRKTTPER